MLFCTRESVCKELPDYGFTTFRLDSKHSKATSCAVWQPKKKKGKIVFIGTIGGSIIAMCIKGGKASTVFESKKKVKKGIKKMELFKEEAEDSTYLFIWGIENDFYRILIERKDCDILSKTNTEFAFEPEELENLKV